MYIFPGSRQRLPRALRAMSPRFPDGSLGAGADESQFPGARPLFFRQMAAAAKKANHDDEAPRSRSDREADSFREGRDALIDAIAAEMVETGFSDLSAERIAARASISRSLFEASFEDVGSAVSAAHGVLFERFVGRLLGACEAQPSWPLKVKVGIGLTLDLAAASPVRARFLMLDSLTNDPALIRQGLEARDRLATLLASGRSLSPYGPDLPGITEQALVGGLAGVILARLVNGEAGHLPALAPELVELTLVPYLGAEAAAAVARRPRPQIDDL
jgi:AcrR family transcriptional regulator